MINDFEFVKGQDYGWARSGFGAPGAIILKN